MATTPKPTPPDRDRRMVTGLVTMRTAEARADGQPSTVTIEGYAAMFDSEAVIGGPQWGFREIIRPGAFSGAIGRDDCRALFNHDPNLVLGRNKSGTLRLSEDGTGLKYSVDPPKTSYAADLVESIARGDVSGSSFSFRATKEAWTEPTEVGQLPLREILECELYDVAPCVYPAYDAASVSVSARSKSEALREERKPTEPEAAVADSQIVGATASRAKAMGLALELEGAQ